jgi:hypothetical protein
MLKISFSETPMEERWILHGRLTVPWVHELRTCWKKNHRTDVGRTCIVDLNEVTFIDRNGERLLAVLVREGAQCVASGIYVKHIVDSLPNALRLHSAKDFRTKCGEGSPSGIEPLRGPPVHTWHHDQR